ncbi:hypothetical protein [Vallitalea okinawensis]|uniref:hypothetical protein n=1 Tax=Vallitalea okinawensis TaxID=2078660 RepID=UPI000CFD2D16|nr:hypothetical protein [Vallitalea okinawensis]
MEDNNTLQMDSYSENQSLRTALQTYPQLSGQVTTFYSSGGAERAKNLKNFIEEMMNDYKQYFPVQFDLHMMILKEDDLRKFCDVPYGLPWIDTDNKPWLICMPFEQAGVIVGGALALSQQNQVPQQVNDKLNDLGVSYETASRLYVDLIGFHEVGHAFCAALGLENLNPWFAEFMATYFCYGFIKEKYPLYATIWYEFTNIIFKDISCFQYKTLEELDNHYDEVGFKDPANYDWYQKQFSKMVDEIYKTEGIDFIHNVIKLFKDKNPSTIETRTLLQKNYPQFENWFNNY